MKSTGIIGVFFAAVLACSCSQTPKDTTPEARAARGVLLRTLGNAAANVQLEYRPDSLKSDSYAYRAENGLLQLTGNSTVALTRGVYDYLKNEKLGMLDWSGPRFLFSGRLPDAQPFSRTSPFAIRHAYNAVTAGYTFPYWTWERWEQEIDWQAMHGFNMMMAPVATEAIATRVWKRLGLTQAEIDSFYVGPAHLPWQRMGNIGMVGGSLPPEWHADQIALQHKILDRLRELGMQPVVQSFAGFVPKAIKRIYPDLVLHNTLWNAGFPPAQRPVLIMPDNKLFADIARMYIEEWQKEFGKADYFLADSFNELELPQTGEPVTSLLADYGERTYRSIAAAAPDATWVIQGWMFAYQRHIWTPETVEALFSRVPDNKVLILDYANDYANNWQPMNAFNGKQWVYGYVPNMGGKTAYTGDLSLYAAGAARALHSPNRKNLVGFTISGEGLENNQVVYELLTDAAWSNDSIDLDSWLENYSLNRYGIYPDKLKESWELMRKSCYSNLIPHPQFGWQLGECRLGWVNRDPAFFRAVELFLQCRDQAGTTTSYRDDAIERAALVLALKADEWFAAAASAYKSALTATGDSASARGLELLSELDRLLESHPLDRLEPWLELARAHSDNPELQKFYESNARQIVTVWGPPVNDYSCRMWSGLVRDFYRERMARVLVALKTGERFDKNAWELSWVAASGISQAVPYADPVNAAAELVGKALAEKVPVPAVDTKDVAGDWTPATVPADWKRLEWTLTADQLKRMKGVLFVWQGGRNRIDIREVTVVADGREIAADRHEGIAGRTDKDNRYQLAIPERVQANNGCKITAVVRGGGGTDSHGLIRLLTE